MERLICPSMMCASMDSLKLEVETLDRAGADIFHMDIMDGRYVPNFAMGLQDLAAVRRNTRKRMDVHLMIEEPGKYVELFAGYGADIIYFHPEAEGKPEEIIGKIRDLGKAPGIAVNPDIPLIQVKFLLPLVDYLLVMTVTPGFSGQAYMAEVNVKIREFVRYKQEYGYKIVVDGAISEEKVESLAAEQVDGFILGTSALFGKGEKYAAIIGRLKHSTNKDK